MIPHNIAFFNNYILILSKFSLNVAILVILRLIIAEYMSMDFKSVMDLSLEVMQDWRVIFITIITLFCIVLANYVVKYRKKPRAPKPPKSPKEEPKKEEGEEGSAEA